MKRRSFLLSLFAAPFLLWKISRKKPMIRKQKFMSYKGLVMAGYQGWFNAPEDGAGRGWNHYQKDHLFEPGHCSIDLWPEMKEYKVKYKTSFVHADGSHAYVFSSYDESTVDVHFKWLKDYNIDGVFMQRFIVTLKDPKGSHHTEKVFQAAIQAAKKYDRAIVVMYDLSGMEPQDDKILIEDWKKLIDQYRLNRKTIYENYLFHRQKPLVAIWGVGFNDGRKYGLREIERVIDFLKNDSRYGGCSVMLGVPTYWRELKNDAIPDPHLHEIIKKADIIQPWFVGRYNEQTYPSFKDRIKNDIAWCRQSHLDYVPVAFPGFSWHNMKPDDPVNMIPRNKGHFFWKQLSGAIECGAEMLYIAMFDEIDEGTAIFKCAENPPIGASKFVAYEREIPTDHYMQLSGQAAIMLKKEIFLHKVRIIERSFNF